MAKQNSIWVSTDLIASTVTFEATERVLVMTGDAVDLIESLANTVAQVDVYDPSYSVLSRLRRYVRAENIAYHDTVYPRETAIYDRAIVFVPKGRDFGRAQLWSAMQALKADGELYVVGPNKGGAKTLIKDAEAMFGSCRVLGYKKSHRLAVTKKIQAQYTYPSEWGAIPTEMRMIAVDTALGSLEVATLPGVFSWDDLDAGTAFLLDNLDMGDAETMLDVGCGYGVIGALAAQQVKQVTMLDDNLLAVTCAEATIKHNGIQNATVLPSNVYSALEKTAQYDLIVSNPPFHRGLEVSQNVAERIIRDAPNHLRAEGRLVIVANEFLPYERVLEDEFAQFGVVGRNKTFKVLEGQV